MLYQGKWFSKGEISWWQELVKLFQKANPNSETFFFGGIRMNYFLFLCLRLLWIMYHCLILEASLGTHSLSFFWMCQFFFLLFNSWSCLFHSFFLGSRLGCLMFCCIGESCLFLVVHSTCLSYEYFFVVDDRIE